MNTNFTQTRDLVLIGGGHTHALVLKKWAMQPLAGARVTLINPAPNAPYSGMLPGFVAGHYSTDELYIDLVRLAQAAGARLVMGKATHIDRIAKTIHVPNRPPIAYDLCSIDVGITSGMPELTGFSEHAVPAKPLDDFARIWDQFCKDKSKSNVAILGAGVAGAEVAMAAAHRMKQLDKSGQVALIDRSDALSRLGRSARKKALSALADLGVTFFENTVVSEITADQVIVEGNAPIAADLTLGAAGTRPYQWLSKLGLTTHEGYINVLPTLQSESDTAIFAVGDCAHLTHAPRPKAGVFAVRQAPILFHNLRAVLRGTALKEYHPQSDYLKLVSLGDKAAMAEKRGFALSGKVMWQWKDHIDRVFMRQFDDLTPMGAIELPQEHALGLEQHSNALCAGCGSKVGRGALEMAVFAAPQISREDVTPLPGDDAALLKFGASAQVLSTDHLAAFCDDPVTMTRIAAVHALGDIYAMGAAPQAALTTLILPRMSAVLQKRTLSEIMQTAQETMGEAGAQIVGGHSSLGSSMTIGFSVTGIAPPNPITLEGAKDGDVLILTKPIGTGVILAANMQLRVRGTDVAAAYHSMSRLLKPDAAALARAHAMTDVTGFGLAGHLANICRASGVGAELDARLVPLLDGALELSEAGLRSSLYPDNLSDLLPLMSEPTTARGHLMLDPQTAGGLLAAMPPEHAQDAIDVLEAAGIQGVKIGTITAKSSGIALLE